MSTTSPTVPGWMPLILRAAGVYNLLWGAWTVLFPLEIFRLIGAAPPNYPSLWQCVGMVVGVYGLAYWLAARDPVRHWPIVATGFIGKLAGVVGFVWALGRSELPLSFGLTNLANDLLWIPAFYFILRFTYLQSADGRLMAGAGAAAPTPELLARFPSNSGQTLAELSRETPLLLVFLRHLGCVFCRESLADLARQRAGLAAAGISIALVHQARDEQAAALTAQYGLDDLPRVSDPGRELYSAFGLPPGDWREVLDWRMWRRAALALLLGWHLQVGVYGGKASQPPGVFLLYDGKVAMNFSQTYPGQRADFASAAEA